MTRAVRPALTAVGVTVAVAIVAIAASAPLARSTPINGAAEQTPVVVLFAVLAGAGIVVLTALAIFIWAGRRRRGDDEPEHEAPPIPIPWLWKLIAVALPLLLAGALVAAALTASGRRRSVSPGAGMLIGGRSGEPHHGGSSGGLVLPGWLGWAALAIVAAAIVAGVALLFVRGRVRAADGPAERDAVRAAVDAAAAALQGPSDPRAAVIAAYAAMERALAAQGVARARSEAPREYLRRALSASRGAERDASTLTGLFEEARYSEHPIPATIRDRAHSALAALRERLGAAGAR